MKYEALNDFVIVKMLPDEEKERGGLIVPVNENKIAARGEVLSFDEEEVRLGLSIGDIVHFDRKRVSAMYGQNEENLDILAVKANELFSIETKE